VTQSKGQPRHLRNVRLRGPPGKCPANFLRVTINARREESSSVWGKPLGRLAGDQCISP